MNVILARSEMMRLAITKSRFGAGGGAEKYASRLVRMFARRVAAVDVITTDPTPPEDFGPSIRWVSVRALRRNNFLALVSFNAAVNRRLARERYDVILGLDRTERQTHIRAAGGCHAAWLEHRGAASSRIRRIGFRLNPFHRKMLDIERRAFLATGLKRLIVNSRMVADEIERHYPGAAGRTLVVHNGVEWTEFQEFFDAGEASRDRIRGELGLLPGRYYYLFAGNGFSRKGLAPAIRALANLPVEAELVVVGRDNREGDYRRMAVRAGVATRVHFHGSRRSIIPHLQASDAFVLPTLYDPFSNACLEALAMGLFTVTSRSNGCAEVIRPGAGAVIQELGSDDSVAETMKAAMGIRHCRAAIRQTVKGLDIESQIGKVVDACLA